MQTWGIIFASQYFDSFASQDIVPGLEWISSWEAWQEELYDAAQVAHSTYHIQQNDAENSPAEKETSKISMAAKNRIWCISFLLEKNAGGITTEKVSFTMKYQTIIV